MSVLKCFDEVKTLTMSAGWPQGGRFCATFSIFPVTASCYPTQSLLPLTYLERSQRAQYLCDMALIGDALLKVTGSFRINYAILGNTDPALHAHIVPRYSWEPDEFRKGPPWSYGKAVMDDRLFDLERDRNLIQQIAEAIRELSE